MVGVGGQRNEGTQVRKSGMEKYITKTVKKQLLIIIIVRINWSCFGRLLVLVAVLVVGNQILFSNSIRRVQLAGFNADKFSPLETACVTERTRAAGAFSPLSSLLCVTPYTFTRSASDMSNSAFPDFVLFE
jgi:hypothetical protein